MLRYTAILVWATVVIYRTATDGFAIIIVIFLFEKDLQQASQDIRDEISEIRRDLPPTAKPYREDFHQYVPGMMPPAAAE